MPPSASIQPLLRKHSCRWVSFQVTNLPKARITVCSSLVYSLCFSLSPGSRDKQKSLALSPTFLLLPGSTVTLSSPAQPLDGGNAEIWVARVEASHGP